MMKNNHRESERGSAAIKFLFVIVILGVLVHAAYNYIPVAYQGEDFKQEMQTIVINTVAIPTGGNPVDIVREKMTRAAKTYKLPSPVTIDVRQVNTALQARVIYSTQVPIIPFGIYTRTYKFDHTATPSGFLFKEN